MRRLRSVRGRSRPHLGVEGDEGVDVGRLVRAIAEARDRGLEQRRDLVEPQAAVQEPANGDVVGGDQRGGRALPDAARFARDPQRREPIRIGSAEVESTDRDEVDGSGRGRTAIGEGQGVLDGGAHVRGAQLGFQRAVHEADR